MANPKEMTNPALLQGLMGNPAIGSYLEEWITKK
jgi:hypothetical protein